jgi:hypothetical protein
MFRSSWRNELLGVAHSRKDRRSVASLHRPSIRPTLEALEDRVVLSGGSPAQQPLVPPSNSGGNAPANSAATTNANAAPLAAEPNNTTMTTTTVPAAAGGTAGSQASGSGGTGGLDYAPVVNLMLLNFKIYLLDINLMIYQSEINALNSAWTQLTGQPPPTTAVGALEGPANRSLLPQEGPSTEQQKQLVYINGYQYIYDPNTGVYYPVYIYNGLYYYITQQYMWQQIVIDQGIPPAAQPTLSPEAFAATGGGESFAAQSCALGGFAEPSPGGGEQAPSANPQMVGD